MTKIAKYNDFFHFNYTARDAFREGFNNKHPHHSLKYYSPYFFFKNQY